MSRRYSPVCHNFWPEVSRWGDDPTLLALYLLTCPHRTTEGLFRLPLGYIVEDLSWRIARVRKTLMSLLDKGFVEYDESASVILIVNALRDQPPENPNQVKGAISRLEELPETPLLGRLYELATEFRPLLAESLAEAFSKRLETLSHSLTQSRPLSPTPPQAQAHSRDAGRVGPRGSDGDSLPLSPFEDEVPNSEGTGKNRPQHEPALTSAPDPHPKATSQSPASDHLTARDVVNIYEELCPSLPQLVSLTPARDKRLTRLANRCSAEELRELFSRMEASDFLSGRSGTWRANLDWLLKGDNSARVLEGCYDNRPPRRAGNVQAGLALVKYYEELEGRGEQS